MPEIYRGYRIAWSGWKPLPQMDAEASQWTAKLVEPAKMDFCFYASAPGSEGWFMRGDCFDLTLRKDQKLITSQSSQDDRDEEKERCHLRLIALLDRVVDCGLDIPGFTDRAQMRNALFPQEYL